MIKKKKGKGESSTDLELIKTNQSKLKFNFKKFYVKAKQFFVKSKPIIKLTDIYLTSSSVIKLFVDIFMIYAFTNAGAIYYIY